ncbi:MAG: DUF1592 domain-containing protein [Planctomycetota bacterium]
MSTRMMTFGLLLAVETCIGKPCLAFNKEIQRLVQDHCIACHDSDTVTGLNFESLGTEHLDDSNERLWVKIFDRAKSGEMPPEEEERPPDDLLENALRSLSDRLVEHGLEQQRENGRVRARRLTKLELGYTLQDLLKISSDVTREFPDEVESQSFDCVGDHQRLSSIHMKSLLTAVDKALDAAIRLGNNPYRNFGEIGFDRLKEWHEKPLQFGGSITRPLKYGDGIVLFRDVDYLTQFTFNVPVEGLYRLSMRMAAYQTDQTLTAKVIVKGESTGAKLLKAIDLPPGQPLDFQVDAFLRPGDQPYLTFVDPGDGEGSVFASGGAKFHKGPGLAILSQRVEGPLNESWPPPSTRGLLGDQNIPMHRGDIGYQVHPSQGFLLERIQDIVEKWAPRIFRRPVATSELEDFIALAETPLAEGRGFVTAARLPLRAMLVSPQFLLFDGQPGLLDQYALANRLSYFLWKSLPDKELMDLATEGQLGEPDVLREQVDRMLDDPKSRRFTDDFVGQWLRVNKVNATTPDDGLYPEFDEVLADAIPKETQAFFAALIAENLTLCNLIDSDFTFVNRRLAEHYGFEGVTDQHIQRVSIPEDSPRGGVLTHAAILKTTANGTTTSPVMRGNFVLTNFLGTPPPPPPPGVGSIEPDIRGKTSIKEILSAHRDNESCQACHSKIDPPGFALEVFDPIGGFRDRYRVFGGQREIGRIIQKLPPTAGPLVDASAQTDDGFVFEDWFEFRDYLMSQKDQVARHFVSQLATYATGGEIEFADRSIIESILDEHRQSDFPVRDLIHAVVNSRLFLNQ